MPTLDDLKRVLAESLDFRDPATMAERVAHIEHWIERDTPEITPREALTAMVEFAKLVLEKSSVRVELKGPTADDLTRILEELK